MTDAFDRIAAITLAGALFCLTLELVRRGRMHERYALLWLLTASVLLLLAAWRGLLTRISEWTGIHYPPSTLFLAALGLELLLLMHFSVAESRLMDETKTLAQKAALLQRQLESQEEELAELRAGLQALRTEEHGLPAASERERRHSGTVS